MQPYIVELPEAPEGILFTLKEISYLPEAPRMNEPFIVKGKIELFKIPFIGPIWVIATVVYPESFWEELIPIWGSPEVRESDTALGGNFEITFKKGFEREGEFSLVVRAYAGPTMPLDSFTLPPFPPVSTEETTFTVGGEVPEEELGFRNFKVLSYSKNGGTPVTPPGVLDLNVGDKLRINVSFEHMGGAVSASLYGAIGNLHHILIYWLDEVLKGETAISVPSSPDWKPYSTGYSVDIPITEAIASGTYSIYAKIIRITGGDIISPCLENVVTIAGGAPAEGQISNLKIDSYDQSVAVSGVCNVVCSFDYQGPAISKTLYAAIGNAGWAGFDEILKASKSLSIPATSTKKSYTATIPISVTSAIDPAGSPYDVYAKLDSLISPYVTDAVTITSVPSQQVFQNLKITSYDRSIAAGGVCNVAVSFDYQGPATTKVLYAAIGNDSWAGFDEILKASVSISIPASAALASRTASVQIQVTATIDPGGSPYDLYTKIVGVIESEHLLDVITVSGAPFQPQFSNLQIAGYDSPVTIGGVCKVTVSFDYLGPAVAKTLYAAIGNKGLVFDEILRGSASVSLPATSTKKTYTNVVSISITSAIDPAGSPYDVYAKLDSLISPSLLSVITVTGAPTTPTISNLRISGYDSPVTIGGACKVTVAFDYLGPAIIRTLYAAIGNKGTFGFDEIAAGSATVSIAAASTTSPRTAQVSIPITSAVDPAGSPYDVYAKIDTIISPAVLNIITVTGVAPTTPEFSDLQILGLPTSSRLGGVLYFTITFKYRGPAVTRQIYVAIGNNHWYGFDEIIYGTASMSIAAATDWTTKLASVSVNISSAISPGVYDIFFKIDSLISPIYENVITITS